MTSEEWTSEKSSSGVGYRPHKPTALQVATFAVERLENNPLFNSGHGAVFTRDGINQLEASVMVSRGFKKRGVGVMGLRRVRNPILLARCMLEHGERDLAAKNELEPTTSTSDSGLDVPSAQGHTQVWGDAAEQLARQYGCEMVEPSYFFTQQRWDEHVRALQKEKSGAVRCGTWSADEYLPQGTCGAVAMDAEGVVCAATSTGGMTNKLTGRVGDTPVPGAGFWAEEWSESGDPTGQSNMWDKLVDSVRAPSLWTVSFAGPLQGFLADCLPTPHMYSPVVSMGGGGSPGETTRSMGVSGTGNGDSFLRVNAVRTVAAMARWKPETCAKALSAMVGPGGELQKSAGERWGKTGEGEGGMIGIEGVAVRDVHGKVIETRGDILMDYNSGGMYRAWIDEDGEPVMSIWNNGGEDEMPEGDHFC